MRWQAPHLNLVKLLITVIVIAVAAPPLLAAQPVQLVPPAFDPPIRVLLVRNFGGASRLYVGADGPFTVMDDAGNLVASGSAGATERVTAAASRLQVLDLAYGDQDSTADSDVAPARITIVPADPQGSIQIAVTASAKRITYRGSVEVCVNAKGTLKIVNVIGVEEYLGGVLKPEMGSGAPIEALKAQAVAARTYAIHSLGKLSNDGADVDDTNRCQNYLGRSAETPEILQAIDQTRGAVLVYNGVVIDAQYCTECGGITAEGSPSEPYLRPVETPACAAKPGWTYTIGREDLDTRVGQDPSVNVGSVRCIEIGKTDSSGRAVEVVIHGTDGTRTVSGARFRSLLGVDNLRSTLFTIEKADGGALTFVGHGWGHGLGMCQAGAIARASGPQAETYAQILADYYTGTSLVPLTTAMIGHAMPQSAAIPSPRLPLDKHDTASVTLQRDRS